MKAKVLIVEDNEDFLNALREGLEREEYEVATAANARQLAERLAMDIPHIILLDLMLPDCNGLDLLSSIRLCTNAPVIVISGKGELVDKVVGLEMGADDYISKPFQIKEVAARIKAQLRRYRAGATPKLLEKKANKLRFGSWTLDRGRLQVFDQKGQSGNLTVKECRLLESLILSAGKILSREQLLEMARAGEFNVTDRAIDTQITRIRRKIGDDGSNPKIIQSVRGAGYIFTAPIEIIE